MIILMTMKIIKINELHTEHATVFYCNTPCPVKIIAQAPLTLKYIQETDWLYAHILTRFKLTEKTMKMQVTLKHLSGQTLSNYMYNIVSINRDLTTLPIYLQQKITTRPTTRHN